MYWTKENFAGIQTSKFFKFIRINVYMYEHSPAVERAAQINPVDICCKVS